MTLHISLSALFICNGEFARLSPTKFISNMLGTCPRAGQLQFSSKPELIGWLSRPYVSDIMIIEPRDCRPSHSERCCLLQLGCQQSQRWWLWCAVKSDLECLLLFLETSKSSSSGSPGLSGFCTHFEYRHLCPPHFRGGVVDRSCLNFCEVRKFKTSAIQGLSG